MAASLSVLLSEIILLLIVFFFVILKENGGQRKCNLGRLKSRRNVLRQFIDNTNLQLQLQALFVVQALFVQLEHPAGTNVQTCCLSTIFSRLTIYSNLLRHKIDRDNSSKMTSIPLLTASNYSTSNFRSTKSLLYQALWRPYSRIIV